MTQRNDTQDTANDNAASNDTTEDITLHWERLKDFNFWGWPVHPAADAFPFMRDEDLADMARDILRNGLREMMILDECDGALVDGRNRARALCLAGVEPEEGVHYYYEVFDDDADICNFVKSLNLNRRQLTKGQSALAAARLYLAGWRPVELSEGQKSRDVLAKQAGISARLLQNAIAIVKRGCPGLIRLVEQDEVSVEAASTVVRVLGVERQEEILAKGDGAWNIQATARRVKFVAKVNAGSVAWSRAWQEAPESRYREGWAIVGRRGEEGRIKGLLLPGRSGVGRLAVARCWLDEIGELADDLQPEDDRSGFLEWLGERVKTTGTQEGLPPIGSLGTVKRVLDAGPNVLVEFDEELVHDHLSTRLLMYPVQWLALAEDEEAEEEAPEEEDDGQEPAPKWAGKYHPGDRLWTTREIRGGRTSSTGSLRTLPKGSLVIIQSGQVRPFIGIVYLAEDLAGEEWSVDEVDLTRQAPEGALVGNDNDKGKGKEAKEVAGLPPGGDDVETWQRGDKAALVYPVQGRDGTSLGFGNVKTTTLEAGCIVTVKMLVQGGKLHIGAEVEGTSWSAQVTPDALERINKPEATGRQVVKAKPWKSGPRACLLESVRVSSLANLTTKTLPVGEVVWVEPGATGGRVWISAQGVKQAVEPSILRQVTDGDLVELLPGDVVTALASTSKDISGVGAKLTKGDLTRVERVEEDGKVLLGDGVRGWRQGRTKLLLTHRPAAPISPSKDRDADPDFKKGARVLVLGGGARGERLDTPLSATVEYGLCHLGLYKVRFDEKPPFDFCRTMTREVHHSYLQPWSEPAQKPANNCPEAPEDCPLHEGESYADCPWCKDKDNCPQAPTAHEPGEGKQALLAKAVEVQRGCRSAEGALGIVRMTLGVGSLVTIWRLLKDPGPLRYWGFKATHEGHTWDGQALSSALRVLVDGVAMEPVDDSPQTPSPEVEPGDEVQVLRALRQGSWVLHKYSLAAVKQVSLDNDGNRVACLLADEREWSAPVDQLVNLAKGKHLALIEADDDNCPAPEAPEGDQEPEAPAKALACPWPVGSVVKFGSLGPCVIVRGGDTSLLWAVGLDGTMRRLGQVAERGWELLEPHKYPAHCGDYVILLRDMQGVSGGSPATVVERDGDTVVLETEAGESVTCEINVDDVEAQGFIVMVPVEPEAAVDRMFEAIEQEMRRRFLEIGPSREWPPEAKHKIAFARTKNNALLRHLNAYRDEIKAKRKEAADARAEEEAAASQLDLEEIAQARAGEVASA